MSIKDFICKRWFGHCYADIKSWLNDSKWDYRLERNEIYFALKIHEARSGERIIVDTGFPKATEITNKTVPEPIREPRILIEKIPTEERIKRFNGYKVYFRESK